VQRLQKTDLSESQIVLAKKANSIMLWFRSSLFVFV